MKIETTPLDVVWIGVITGAVLYLVLRTVATLERMTNKVDSMVDHIGNEVESAIHRLSKEANLIIHNFEKNASGYKEHLFQHVQDMELQCYRTKNGIFAMGFGSKSPKRKYHHSNSSRSMSLEHNSESLARLVNRGAPAALPNDPAPAQVSGSAEPSTTPSKKAGGKQLVAIHKCVERILKAKYKKFFIRRHKSSKHPTSSSATTTSCTSINPS